MRQALRSSETWNDQTAIRLQSLSSAKSELTRRNSGAIVGNSQGPKKKLEKSTSCRRLTPTWIHLLGSV
jgi:hypothetical protein